MKLKKSNPLVSFYLYWNLDEWKYRYGGKPINMCSMFWSLLLQLTVLVGLTMIFSIIGVSLYIEVGSLWNLLIILTYSAAAIGGLTLIAASVITVAIKASSSETLAFIKSNYCPQITLED